MAILLTKKAAQEIGRFKSSDALSDETFLRVGVSAGGCSGFDYKLEFDDNYDEDKDIKYEIHGVIVVIDKKSNLFLDGTTIDYKDGLDDQGFSFENPNATRSCGCGKSFGV